MAVTGWERAGPWLAALAAVATVLLVLVPAGAGGGTVPAPPPDPAPLVSPSPDRLGQSLDRCARALDGAGLAGLYPPRQEWDPLARLAAEATSVTLLDGDVPFACVTSPSAVEVSDPRAAVPIDAASLLLTTADGVVAAVAPEGVRVEVLPPGARPAGRAADRHFLGVAGPITDAAQLAVTIGDGSGLRSVGAPPRLVPPAVRLVDRRSVPPDRSPAAADLLRLCTTAAGEDGAGAGPGWEPAQVTAYRDRGRAAALLLARRGPEVGGCAVTPDATTPLEPWFPAVADSGARPFTWLAAPPELADDVVAGTVRSDVVRMQVRDADGRPWRVDVAAGTFAGPVPPGARADPRTLTVRAFDADDVLLYDGPAV